MATSEDQAEPVVFDVLIVVRVLAPTTPSRRRATSVNDASAEHDDESSMPLNRPVETSHARGLGGTPSRGHCSRAAAGATVFARSKSPSRRSESVARPTRLCDILPIKGTFLISPAIMRATPALQDEDVAQFPLIGLGPKVLIRGGAPDPSWAMIRTEEPARSTEPSTIMSTPSSRTMCRSGLRLSLNCITVVLEAHDPQGAFLAGSAMSSAVMPSTM